MISTRQSLIDAVEQGDLLPSKAEAEAERLGLEPLTFAPDPTQYDPMREAFWTPAMAVAWITSRRADEVRETWPEYRKKFRDWQCVIEKIEDRLTVKYRLTDFPPTTLFDMISMDEEFGEKSRFMSTLDAIAELIFALRRGDVKATGLFEQSRYRIPIEPFRWIDLKYILDEGQDRFAPDPALPSSSSYSSVAVESEQILKIWKNTLIRNENRKPSSRKRGRPTATPLILFEYIRGVKTGDIPRDPAQAAQVLIQWLRATHPSEKPPLEETIRRRIRELLDKQHKLTNADK